MLVIIKILDNNIVITETNGFKKKSSSNLKWIIIGNRTNPAAAGVEIPRKYLIFKFSLLSLSDDEILNLASLEDEQTA